MLFKSLGVGWIQLQDFCLKSSVLPKVMLFIQSSYTILPILFLQSNRMKESMQKSGKIAFYSTESHSLTICTNSSRHLPLIHYSSPNKEAQLQTFIRCATSQTTRILATPTGKLDLTGNANVHSGILAVLKVAVPKQIWPLARSNGPDKYHN